MNYVQEFGKDTFDERPFSEIDALVLTELGYSPLEEIVSSDMSGKEFSTVEEIAHHMGENAERLLRDNPMMITQERVDLTQEIGKAKRYQSLKFFGMKSEVDSDITKQFAAFTVEINPNVRIVIYRGTDETLIGWKEDFMMTYSPVIPAHKDAKEYLEQQAKLFDGEILLSGHSKGGNFAIYAAAFSDDSIKNRIIRVYNNDGPGFRDEVINSNGYQIILPKIQSIIPQTSIIGQLLSNKGKQKVICSKANGIFQHDAMTWEVTKDKFVPAELDDFSRFVKATLENWLEKLDAETRCSIISIVFSMIEETESETFREFGSDLIKNAVTVIKSLVKLPREKKRELIAALSALIKSSGKVTINHLAQFSKK